MEYCQHITGVRRNGDATRTNEKYFATNSKDTYIIYSFLTETATYDIQSGHLLTKIDFHPVLLLFMKSKNKNSKQKFKTKMDVYLFLHFTEFLTLREFVIYTRTSKLYREKLVLDNIQKRYHQETRLAVSSDVNDDTTVGLTSHTETGGWTRMTFSARHETIVFDYVHRDILLEIPVRNFSWYGILQLANDMADLENQEFTIRAEQTSCVEIDIVMFYDKQNERVIMREFQCSYITNMRQWLRRDYIKRYAMSILLVSVTIVGTYPRPDICVMATLVAFVFSAYIVRGKQGSARPVR